MDKKKAIIHIGGSFLQIPSIRWARELGLKIILTDWNKDNLGRELVDGYENISGTDSESLLELAKGVSKKYDFVGAYSNSDFGLKSVAGIAEEFDLPGCPRSSVELALNKAASKKIWLENKINTPLGLIVQDTDTLNDFIDKSDLPVIIKPVDSSGSRGVRSVWERKDLIPAFEDAKKYSNEVLVEQYVVGKHIDVNGFFADGQFVRCGIMERFFSDLPYHYPVWGCEPSSLSLYEENLVYQVVEKAAKSLGINEGLVKADLIWSNGEPVLIEIAPRFHGDVSTSFVTPLSRKNSPIKAWFAFMARDNQYEKYLPEPFHRYAGYMAIFPQTKGVLKSIIGLQKAKSMPGVSDVFIRVKPGDEIKEHKNNTSLGGFIWATGDSMVDLNQTLKKALDILDFEVD